MNETQKNITSKFENSDQFLPYIDEIRFPMYKSLVDDLTLPLNWPIIALVGPNGTNKSSILQAISAAPEGRSLAEFWFSTEVDDIDRGPRGKATHRFVYRYRFDRSGVSAECRKYRGSKKYRSAEVPKALAGRRDPDYWEPTKRVTSDRMALLPTSGYAAWLSESRDRWNQIKKEVTYLDFRSELSAFDKFIHHESFDHWTPDATRKRYKAVLRSKWIARALAGVALPKKERPRLITPLRQLSAEEVSEVSMILGKPIEKILIIEHKFFGPSGFTVRLQLKGTGAEYSEAHAGSGEYAAIRLVDAIKNAPQRSLILLDEPEVSLHPGAQIELIKFIEREVLRNCHQVVISTHSPVLAAQLPDQAIKVFGFDTSRQQVVLVADGCSSTEAFTHLGHITLGPTRPRLIVEDDLAAEIVRASLRRHAPTKLNSLEIIPFPGGADGIVKNVLPALTIANVAKTGILLDGDKVLATFESELDVREAANSAKFDIERLNDIWHSQFHETDLNLYSNSDHGRDPATLHACLIWATDHLGHLPGRSPEEALAIAINSDIALPINDWKKFWVEKTRAELHLTNDEMVTAEDILNVQRLHLARLPDESLLLLETHKTIERIIEW
ncbi:ATP-binding protein [Mycobacterium sp. UM_Kg27]|uniref:ATP-binding protein n=1 Tax=Mycobacterium sp. UM_Kg27 TaxID=1545693 RepID=UPI00178CE051|nr:ATP-binding protein [Mycobacterium sp. UM_Kg27]